VYGKAAARAKLQASGGALVRVLKRVFITIETFRLNQTGSYSNCEAGLYELNPGDP
jgi:hypothetical protein